MTDYLFYVADTRLSSSHQTYGVHGHSSPENMYNMNWETYSFMRMRHVPVLGTLWGEAISSYTLCSGVGCHGSIKPTKRVCLPGAPNIQMNVPAIYHNALPPNITPSSSLETVGNQRNCHFFAQQMGQSHAPYPCRPHHGHPPQNQRIPLLCVTDHSSGHTKEWESLTLA